MAFKIKTKLKNLVRKIRVLKNRKRILNLSADQIESQLIKNWNKSLGGDGAPMPPLKEKYKLSKLKQGGMPFRDIKLKGTMRKSFTRKISGESVTVGFTSDQQKKARGNATYAPNFMATSDHMASVTADVIVDLLEGKIK